MVYQTLGQVKTSCIKLLIWVIYPWLHLHSLHACKRLHGRGHHLPVLSAHHLCKMKLSTTHNSYSKILGITRTHTNISIPINSPLDGSEQSFYTLHHCSKTLYPFATSAPSQGAA